MSHEYRNEKDRKNNEKINQLLNGMPEFIEDYHTHMVARNRSTNTILGYMYEINTFFNYLTTLLSKEKMTDLEVTDLEKLRLNHIESYTSSSEDGIKLSPSARCRKLSVLKSLYKYYIGIGKIKTNPTLLAEAPKIPDKSIITLSDAEVTRLLTCIKNQDGVTRHSKIYNERMILRDTAIVMVLLGTGMRISELVGLNINDIDTSDEEKVYLNIIRKGGDEDKAPALEPVYNALADYIEFSRPLLVTSEKENALFISIQGTRMTTDAVQKMMKKYCRAAKLSDTYSPHKMRATFATKVYKTTKDIYAVKDSLHHSSITTSKHYVDDKENRITKAAEAAVSFFQ